MSASASRSSSSQAALPPWVKELLTSVPATSTCIVAVSRGDFVVKVYPATPHHAPLQQDQKRKAHQPRRAQREGAEPQARSTNARRLRSANRAKDHAALRRSRRLHLQMLLHRHLWRMTGWQRMQMIWTEWSRTTAPPLPLPAPPQPRPLPIVDPTAFPALPSAPAVASAGLRKREASDNPRPSPKTALVALEQPSSGPWTRMTKPRRLRGFYLPASTSPSPPSSSTTTT